MIACGSCISLRVMRAMVGLSLHREKTLREARENEWCH